MDFSETVERYTPRLLALAYGIVGRREVAEDVVQDALIKAYEHRGAWHGQGSMGTWLYRIVYNTAVSTLRRGDRFFEELPVSMAEFPEEEDDRIPLMLRALDRLSGLDRTLITLFYMEEQSVRDIAAICSLSEANVKTRLHRARKRLYTLIDE